MPSTLDNVIDRLKRALTTQPGVAGDGDHMLYTTGATLMAGEDTTVGVLKVEERFGYTFVSLGNVATANTIKTGAGFLHAITNNSPQAGQIIQIGDGTGSGVGVFSGVTNASVVSPYTLYYDVTFANGLTVMTQSVAAGHNLTVSWR